MTTLLVTHDRDEALTLHNGEKAATTLAAAIGTEINKKGDASRFARLEPGKFTLR